jgi:hypothetical protein
MAIFLVERNNIAGLFIKQSAYVAPIIFHTDVLKTILPSECRELYITHEVMLNIILKMNQT